MVIIYETLPMFLAKYPFASAHVMSCPFGVRFPWRRKLSALNWGPGNTLDDGCHICSATLGKIIGAHRPFELLELMRGREAYDFDGIATAAESCSSYH
jgi:hypothetical protein